MDQERFTFCCCSFAFLFCRQPSWKTRLPPDASPNQQAAANESQVHGSTKSRPEAGAAWSHRNLWLIPEGSEAPAVAPGPTWRPDPLRLVFVRPKLALYRMPVNYANFPRSAPRHYTFLPCFSQELLFSPCHGISLGKSGNVFTHECECIFCQGRGLSRTDGGVEKCGGRARAGGMGYEA